MKLIFALHAVMLVVGAGVFFAAGWFDKKRLQKASVTHKPNLLFSHEKLVFEDGGTVWWESIVYQAKEKRRAIVYEKDGERTTNNFQGVAWEWKYHNLGWICAIVGGSFVGSLVGFHRR